MTAGAGILHIEQPPEALVVSGGLFHGFQLWVNLPARDKFIEPRYQDLRASEVGLLSSSDGGSLLRLIAGELAGQRGPGVTHTPITMLHATVHPAARLRLPWNPVFNAVAYVLSGRGRFGLEGRPAEMGQLVLFGPGDAITATADARQESRSPNLDVLILGGQPIGEPVAWSGPFVMNSHAELAKAFEDYRAGRLGTIPAQCHGRLGAALPPPLASEGMGIELGWAKERRARIATTSCGRVETAFNDGDVPAATLSTLEALREAGQRVSHAVEPSRDQRVGVTGVELRRGLVRAASCSRVPSIQSISMCSTDGTSPSSVCCCLASRSGRAGWSCRRGWRRVHGRAGRWARCGLRGRVAVGVVASRAATASSSDSPPIHAHASAGVDRAASVTPRRISALAARAACNCGRSVLGARQEAASLADSMRSLHTSPPRCVKGCRGLPYHAHIGLS